MSSWWQKDILEYLPGFGRRPLPLNEIALFCRKLSFLLDAGISIKEALPILAVQSGRQTKAAVNELYLSVCRGESFSGALAEAKVFPKLICGLAAVGEASGSLSSVCEQAAVFYERRSEARNELAGALAYPALVSVLMLAVMVMAVAFVLPSYAQVFSASDVQLPFLTQALLDITDFFAEYGAYVLGGLAILVIAAVYFCRGPGRNVFNAILLNMPLYRTYINARLSQVLYYTLATGLTVADSITLCADIVQNMVLKADLLKAATDVTAGLTICDALGRMKYIDSLFTDMMRVGEETANLVRATDKCEKYFDAAYTNGVKRLNKLVEPVLTIVLGALLGALMLAVILPTFQLANVGWG